MLRRHLGIAVLLAAGAALRALVWIGFPPALYFLGDSIGWRDPGQLARPGSADATVLAQQLFAIFSNGHDQPEPCNRFARNVAAIDRVLPDRQPRA